MSTERSDEPDVEALCSAVSESRIVLDHRIDTIGKMDDIAMHTLRTSVLVIGIFVSAAGLAGPDVIGRMTTFTIGLLSLGLVCLFGTILAGLATLTTSSLSFGIANAHRRLLVDDGLDRHEWNALLLEEYGRWETELRSAEANNARWLYYVLWSFVAGIALLACGIGVMIVRVVG